MILYISTKFHENISKVFFELLCGHEIMTDGQTDVRTDNVITKRAPPTSSDGTLISSRARAHCAYRGCG